MDRSKIYLFIDCVKYVKIKYKKSLGDWNYKDQNYNDKY